MNECKNYKPISKYILNIFKLPYDMNNTQCTNCYDDETEREKKIDYCQTKEEHCQPIVSIENHLAIPLLLKWIYYDIFCIEMLSARKKSEHGSIYYYYARNYALRQISLSFFVVVEKSQ